MRTYVFADLVTLNKTTSHMAAIYPHAFVQNPDKSERTSSWRSLGYVRVSFKDQGTTVVNRDATTTVRLDLL